MDISEIRVIGTDLFVVSEGGQTYRYTGTLINMPSNPVVGEVWISSVTGDLHYIDEFGANRKILKTDLGERVGAAGEAWVHQNYIHWLDGSLHKQQGHGDIAHSDTHDDVAHTDSGYSDSGYSNYADSWHNDTPFSDVYTNSPHQDAYSDVTHSDWHFDGNHTDCHTSNYDDGYGDYYRDNHGDRAFTDSYANAPAQNTHNNVAHTDSGYSDGGYSDHANSWHNNIPFSDSHSNIPYTDTPVIA